MQTASRRWLASGDLNGFLGLVVDNLSIMGFLSMALIHIFGFPADIVFLRMFPGTALGVLLGNIAYTVMARRLAGRTGREDVTAMPLGLDAPTSIGMALLVLGPAFLSFKQGGMDDAAFRHFQDQVHTYLALSGSDATADEILSVVEQRLQEGAPFENAEA